MFFLFGANVYIAANVTLYIYRICVVMMTFLSQKNGIKHIHYKYDFIWYVDQCYSAIITVRFTYHYVRNKKKKICLMMDF